MSSRRPSLRKRTVPASGEVAPGKFSAPRRRGPRRPEAADFEVTLEMPQSVPILERELRAIEILLGAELQDLLGNESKKH